MPIANPSFIIRYARTLGWGLTALAYLLAFAWLNQLFGPASRETTTIMWALIYGIIIITAAILRLSVVSKCHDLVFAGILAFYSTIILGFGGDIIRPLLP
ncbi:hypothetical protein [Corynebacterium freiburgense]|uniref:hypothetical protein n=1 Tax=Corynebacterium freiburgense TaxID=556548 RepID=UPI00041859F9|nr:hypothetical protein [Corynebacterium freiburgense]WJZ01964.1 hypothetical protein CFREI_03305 [Corynebacterium freiburgense]